MNGMMDGNGSFMWGTGWGGVLVIALVVIVAAALAKYLFFNSRR